MDLNSDKFSAKLIEKMKDGKKNNDIERNYEPIPKPVPRLIVFSGFGGRGDTACRCS